MLSIGFTQALVGSCGSLCDCSGVQKGLCMGFHEFVQASEMRGDCQPSDTQKNQLINAYSYSPIEVI